MKLRQIRKKANLSVEELSKQAGISESYIYQLERGDKKPSYNIMTKISKILEMPVQELFFNE